MSENRIRPRVIWGAALLPLSLAASGCGETNKVSISWPKDTVQARCISGNTSHNRRVLDALNSPLGEAIDRTALNEHTRTQEVVEARQAELFRRARNHGCTDRDIYRALAAAYTDRPESASSGTPYKTIFDEDPEWVPAPSQGDYDFCIPGSPAETLRRIGIRQTELIRGAQAAAQRGEIPANNVLSEAEGQWEFESGRRDTDCNLPELETQVRQYLERGNSKQKAQ